MWEVEIPPTYFIPKFFQHGYKVSKNGNNYISCCPYCREGKSWGKSKRLYYLPAGNYLFCHNCSTRWEPYWWLREIAGMDHKEIVDDMRDCGITDDDIYFEKVSFLKEEKRVTKDLPDDCINLLDEVQWVHHKNEPIFQIAQKYMTKRRLTTAKFRPMAYYISTIDKKHKNRLIIPYHDHQNRIIYYQSRALLESDEKQGKYFFKLGADHKEIFNLNRVDIDHDRIYLFEGALDCMFVQNGVSCGGVHVTSHQRELLNNNYPFHEWVYVLDNPRYDPTVIEKIEKIIENGGNVFLWGGPFEKYKDFSQMAEDQQLDSIAVEDIDKYVYSGKKASAVLQKILLHKK